MLPILLFLSGCPRLLNIFPALLSEERLNTKVFEIAARIEELLHTILTKVELRYSERC